MYKYIYVENVNIPSQTPLGGIHLHETKKKFMDGSLHPANVLMCPHTCVTNLPKPREVHPGRCTFSMGNKRYLLFKIIYFTSVNYVTCSSEMHAQTIVSDTQIQPH